MRAQQQSTEMRKSGPAAGTVLQRRASDPKRGGAEVPGSVMEILRTAGQTLDTVARADMEAGFGHDFGHIRVHTDEKAAASADAVHAAAYTVGEHIVFGKGHYDPQSRAGQVTLAHELAHTIQQESAATTAPQRLTVTNVDDPSERQAEMAADAVINGEAPPSLGSGTWQVARTPPPPTPPVAAAPTKKKVTVNITTLHGATRNATAALTYANTKVYNQADVEIVKGAEVTLDEPKSKAILGSDLILDEYSTPSAPTSEEKALFKENQTKDAITMYFVKEQSAGSTGEAFWSALGHGFVGFVNNNSSNDVTFSHELGHVLLDDGGHSVPDDTYLMWGAKSATKYKLTPGQITTIKASPFAK